MSFLLSFYCLFNSFCLHSSSEQVSCLTITKNFVIDTRCTAPFTHYYWLSRPTGFWLSKKEKESVISFGHKYEKLKHNKVLCEKLKKNTHKLFYFSQPNTWLAMLPIMLIMECSKLMSAHLLARCLVAHGRRAKNSLK